MLIPVNGKGVSFAEPKILNSQIKEDPVILEALEEFRDDLKQYQVPIGNTTVDLIKHYDSECNIGNLVTDAGRKCYWNDTTISFQNNGGIRYEFKQTVFLICVPSPRNFSTSAFIFRSNILKGELTYEDVFAILPFNNSIDRVTMKGIEIRDTLEDAVSSLCPNQSCSAGGFLQVSGIKMKVLVTDNNSGHRIQSLKTLCSPNNDNEYCDLEDEKVYNVALCSFLATQVHREKTNLSKFVKDRQIGIPDYQCLKEYIEEKKTISPTVEGRIVIDYEETENGSNTIQHNFYFLLLSLFVQGMFFK